MKQPWGNNSCNHIQSYLSLYPVQVAAALWCGIPSEDIQKYLKDSSEIARGIYSSPYVPCLEPRCRAIQNAIDNGILPVCRERGVPVIEHVAPERRHVRREALKAWIAKEFPADKPAFLFDEVEQNAHSAISPETYLSLKSSHDDYVNRLKEATNYFYKIEAKKVELMSALERYKKLELGSIPVGDRAETTYLNIIGGLLDLMLNRGTSVSSVPSYRNQTEIISTLLHHHGNKQGISQRTLEEKFASAKRSF